MFAIFFLRPYSTMVVPHHRKIMKFTLFFLHNYFPEILHLLKQIKCIKCFAFNCHGQTEFVSDNNQTLSQDIHPRFAQYLYIINLGVSNSNYTFQKSISMSDFTINGIIDTRSSITLKRADSLSYNSLMTR